MPVAYAERIHAAVPGSELVLAPKVGHWLFVDGTQIFTDSVLGFLARIQNQVDMKKTPGELALRRRPLAHSVRTERPLQAPWPLRGSPAPSAITELAVALPPAPPASPCTSAG